MALDEEIERDPGPLSGLNITGLVRNAGLRKNTYVWKSYQPYIRRAIRRDEIVTTLNLIEYKQAKKLKIVSQSKDMPQMGEGEINSSVIEQKENFLDVGGTDTEKVGTSKPNYPLNVGQMEKISLADYLSRPVELDDFSVALDASSDNTYSIWDLWSLHPSVRAKLRNFAYFRGNLHVRITISASPFHFGRFLVSYQPYAQRNTNIIAHLSNYAVDTVARPAFMNYLSQARDAFTMDVRDNRPMEMVIPFISTKPVHRLYNSDTSAIGASTSFDDFAEAGDLFLWTLNDIKAVTATASPISVQVVVWAEDVHLGTTTATQIAITTESKDEMEQGPVEKVGSMVADVGRGLFDTIILNPLAEASKIADSWLGFSRPPIVKEAIFVKNRPFANSALTIGSETVDRLTLDPKQETTIDPTIVGAVEDELSIAHLSSIESYVDTFSWSPTDALMADPIWKCRCHPQLVTSYDIGTFTYIQPTAMAYVAAPFIFWRGDIEFRFDIVCSAYHRGKLAFYFEPNVYQGALIDADVALNKNFIRIVDIQETQSVSFCCKWASPRAWNETLQEYEVLDNMFGGTYTNQGTYAPNGYIAVVPFTDVQSPDDSTIEVNVFVKSQKIEYGYFSNRNLPLDRTYESVMAFEAKAESYDPEAKNEVETTCLELNESSADFVNTGRFHFGEHPLSFRSLLHRYSTTAQESDTATGSSISTQITFATYPEPLPKYGDINTSSYISIFQYLRYAFMGMRGGVRKRVRMLTTNEQHKFSSVSVSNGDYQPFLSTAWTYSAAPNVLHMVGSAQYMPDTNAGVEVEIPFYSNNLFVFSFADDQIGSNSTGDMNTRWLKRYRMQYEVNTVTDDVSNFIEETAIGEDFTFLRFTGAPFYTMDNS